MEDNDIYNYVNINQRETRGGNRQKLRNKFFSADREKDYSNDNENDEPLGIEDI